MKQLRKRLGIAMLYLISFALLLFTSPQHIRPVLLIVPLLVFFLAVFFTLVSVSNGFARRRGRKLSRNAIITTAVATAFPVMLLLLQSIGQLSARDVITLLLIIFVFGFYVAKVGFGRKPT